MQVAVLLGIALLQEAVRYLVAAVLFGLGIHSLVGHHHACSVRMRVGFHEEALRQFVSTIRRFSGAP